MLRRMIKAGTYAGLAAGALVGCSLPQWGARSSPTSSALADRSTNVPVATPPQPVESRTTNDYRGATNPRTSNTSYRSGAVEIHPGVAVATENAQRANPSNEMASTMLETATVLELRGNLEAARQQYERALSVSPNDPKLLVSFARFADRHGQGSVAADLYQRVLDSEASHPLLWSEAGLSLTRNGRGEAGLAACRKAASAAPDNQRILANLSEAESVARQFRGGQSSLADSWANPQHIANNNPFTPISLTSPSPASTNGASPSTVTVPFSPGSTARQYERRLPPVVTSRRTSTEAEPSETHEATDERLFVPPTELEESAAETQPEPPNTKDFLPGGE